jgi:hypothetical protein
MHHKPDRPHAQQVQGCEELLVGEKAPEEEGDEEELDEDEAVNEVRFVVDDEQVLGVLFAVFSECQSLHPDDVDPDEGDFMFNVEEVEEGALDGYDDDDLPMPSAADVDMLTRPDVNNPDRFADAD